MIHLRQSVVVCILALVTFFASGGAQALTAHTFELDTRDWEEQPTTVHVAGSFNDWTGDATPLEAQQPGRYRATVELPAGVTLYKFVIDGERWISDPKRSDKAFEEPDTFGGVNSAVRLGGAAGREQPAAAGAMPPVKAGLHRFVLDTSDWEALPATLTVAGDFNGWNKTASPMQHAGQGVFWADVALGDGVRYYKFVADGDRWLNDPRNSDKELETSDGNGGMNSAVLIGFDVRKLPPAPDAGFAEVALSHDPADALQRSVVSENLLLLGVKTQENDVQRMIVLWQPADAEPGTDWQEMPLQPEAAELARQRFAALVPIKPAGQTIRYIFELQDGPATAYLSQKGLTEQRDRAAAAGWTVDVQPTFETPDWAKSAVWYQIFPERFRNGNPSNDPGGLEGERLLPWTSDWWQTHPEAGEVLSTGAVENFYQNEGNVWQRRYGGDLQGVQEKLPYLRTLGINAIYLNPIFEADSMHKYDTADFRHVDDNFGVKAADRFAQFPGETDDPATWGWSESDLVFLEFIEEAHAQGFKVVIDGVFNHTGTSHPFFQDVLKHGKESRYADWFEITDWGQPENWGKPETVGQPGGIQYNAWDKPSGALPVFKNDAQKGLADGPRQHIFDITRRWLDPNGDGDPSDGIDGWRLDVPGDIAHPFWIEWRKLVKGINPDAYISGEIWSWAQPWLQGDQFDAVMNYQFAMPAQDFFVDQRDAISPSEFGRRLSAVAYGYPMQVSLAQMNLFDSHDTDRLASMFVNPDRPYDGQNRLQDNGPSYSPRKPDSTEWARMRQAVALQMTFLGAPMVYYGSEAGMWSPDDPSNRMPMVWEELQPYAQEGVEFDASMFAHYQRLIALRHHLPALQLGTFHVVLTDDARGIFAFERVLGDDRVTVVLNRSNRPAEVELPRADGRYVDLLDPAAAAVMWDGAESGEPGEPGEPGEVPAGDVRPELVVRETGPTLSAAEGTLTVVLEPYGSAVLVRR